MIAEGNAEGGKIQIKLNGIKRRELLLPYFLPLFRILCACLSEIGPFKRFLDKIV